MCFQLVYGDFEHRLPLPFEEHDLERLRCLLGDQESMAAEHSRNVVARRIVEVVAAIMDGELLPPSTKQIKYAEAIARELALDLPPEVLKYREQMAVFLGNYAPQYRQKKAYEKGSMGMAPSR